MKRKIFFVLLLFAVVGLIDASYLTYEHYSNIIPPCSINRILPFFSDCGIVLRSKYSVILGVPVALLGFIHYLILTLVIGLAIITNKKLWWFWIYIQAWAGALFSLYLMFLQLFVINNICMYCTLSALTSFTLFALAYMILEYERKFIYIYAAGWKYRNLLKPFLFLTDPEFIHERMLSLGEFLGSVTPFKHIISHALRLKHFPLHQKILGIEFTNPTGLSAGFDYEASLPFILPGLGFGFETIGTITNKPYRGNPPPRLGRLPESRSLLVNKGFKNKGVEYIIEKLKNKKFEIPVGISIGRTNSQKLTTQAQSVKDVVDAFKTFEHGHVENAYYELNISCPNLFGNISFYPPKQLKELLDAMTLLKIKKPVFVKMPIEKNNKEFLDMLSVLSRYRFVKGVIIGNLQKNRKDPALVRKEVERCGKGNFSGKPCEQRSNELIGLAYKKYKKKFVIVGCGGVFSAQDAYKKIKLGASLVQLITGMIFNGPTVIAQINLELVSLLRADGFAHISEAIGKDIGS